MSECSAQIGDEVFEIKNDELMRIGTVKTIDVYNDEGYPLNYIASDYNIYSMDDTILVPPKHEWPEQLINIINGQRERVKEHLTVIRQKNIEIGDEIKKRYAIFHKEQLRELMVVMKSLECAVIEFTEGVGMTNGVVDLNQCDIDYGCGNIAFHITEELKNFEISF